MNDIIHLDNKLVGPYPFQYKWVYVSVAHVFKKIRRQDEICCLPQDKI